MKTCVYCGKSLADTALRCKYCERDLPAEGLPTHFQCNTCGSPLAYDGVGAMVKCAACGNAVVVPTALREAMQSQTPSSEEIPLSRMVENLLLEGNEAEAVRLLRERASLPLESAVALVAILRAGDYGDAQGLIIRAMRGELP